MEFIDMIPESKQFAINVVHPQPTSWTTIFTHIRDALSEERNGQRLNLVPFSEWLNRLDNLPEEQAIEAVHDLTLFLLLLD
jgi:hypothetical protein